MSSYGTGPYGPTLPYGSPSFPTPTPPVSSAQRAQLGVIEATSGIIGEADNEIGGFVVTRLTSPLSKGDATFPVESTLGWAESGKLALKGVLYYYSGKTLVSFTGITYIAAGVAVAGAATDYTVDSPVLDITKSRGALERLRRAMLVDYAEGEDLKVVGRNIGVFYEPIMGDDDQFRQVIKNMGYCPKGTIQGIELALDCLIPGGGAYVYEDLIRYPCTVFIYLPSSYVGTGISAGKTFMTGHAWAVIEGSQDEIVLAQEPLSIMEITLKDLGEYFDFLLGLPSALTYEYYPGATPGNAFSYQGSVPEGTGASHSASVGLSLTNGGSGTVYYRMSDLQGARVEPESYVEISTNFKHDGVSTYGELKQMSISIFDGDREVNVGFQNDDTMGFFNAEGGGFIGSSIAWAVGSFHDVIVKKFGTDRVELWVDGALAVTEQYSSFSVSTSEHKIEFGIRGSATSLMAGIWKNISIHIDNVRDYWGAKEDGTGDVNTANPTRLVLGGGSSYTFVTGDVGTQIRLSGSGVTNPSGGNNNGDWVIDSFVSGSTVELLGAAKVGATLDTVNPKRITLDTLDGFVFPDDLGKEIVISGSGSGNDGAYVIDKLLEKGALVDLATYNGVIETRTNICEVVAATFVTETDLTYQLKPVFVTETNLDWRQSEASSFTGDTVTLRQSLWKNDLLMDIALSDVLTAQLLKDALEENEVIQETPTVLYEFYPFYLADPLGALYSYISTITIGGVIPEFRVT